MFGALSSHHITWHVARHTHAPAARPASNTSSGTALALVAMGLSVIVLAQDFSAVNVALPSIERAFDSSIDTVQWVINAYALVFAMLIVTGGRLADQFGRRRVFLIGTTIFAAMSLLAGLAPNVYWLIGARALMGIGGALMWPAILGMTYAALPANKAGLAGGLIIGAAGIGQAIGPITGGALTQWLDWRWIQFVNLPIAAFAMAVTWLEVHQGAGEHSGERLDYPGIVTLSVGLLAFLFALDQSVSWGWGDPRIIICLVVAIVLVAAFVVIERRAGSSALVPGSVIGRREFAAACVAIALIAAPFFASLLFLPQFMQKLLGYSPIQAGLGLLPMLAVFAAISFVGGQLYDKLGAKLMVSAGAVCLTAGPLLLSVVNGASGYSALVPGMVVLGIGLGLFFSAATTAGVQSVDPSQSSLAGGLVYMFQIAGGSIGLGLTTTVVTSTAQSRLLTSVAALGVQITRRQALALHGVLTGTETSRQMLQQFSPAIVAKLPALAGDAFAAGMQRGYLVDAALALVAVVLAVLFIGQRSHAPEQPTAEKPGGSA